MILDQPQDTETHHICGTCGKLQLLSEFYKDGKSRDGKIKYRRDCKDCYRRTRLRESRAKKAKVTLPLRRKPKK